MTMESKKSLLAFVGMPGAGKSEAISYLSQKGIPFVRFGQVTDDGLREKGLPITPENERVFREALRKELGMAAYAIKAAPKIRELLQKHPLVVLDGLYSWGEYVYLKKGFPQLLLVHVYAQPSIRYERLGRRLVRPLTSAKAKARDVAEIENLDKAGPIAIADFLITNNANKEALYAQVDAILHRI